MAVVSRDSSSPSSDRHGLQGQHVHGRDVRGKARSEIRLQGDGKRRAELGRRMAKRIDQRPTVSFVCAVPSVSDDFRHGFLEQKLVSWRRARSGDPRGRCTPPASTPRSAGTTSLESSVRIPRRDGARRRCSRPASGLEAAQEFVADYRGAGNETTNKIDETGDFDED